MDFTSILKMAVSTLMGFIGGYLLFYLGRKTQNSRMMVIGGILLVLSYWLF
jgi:drug/metabolite transporter superfamily protein YnfA